MLWQKLLGANAAAPSQPIQYVGSRVVSYSGTTSDISVSLTSLTGGLASAPAAGDLVIVYFGTASQTDRNLVVAGYTELADITSYTQASYTGTNLAVAYKFMGSTPDTTVTITGGTLNAADAGGVYVSVWRNVNTTTPFDVAIKTATGRFGPDANPVTITPVTPGAFIVVGAVGGHLQGTQTFSSVDLSDFKSVGANDTYDATIGGGYKQWVSGAFDPQTFGFSAIGQRQFETYCAATVALRPAATVSAPSAPPNLIQSTQNSAFSMSLTINKPTATVEGNLMVMVCGGGFSGSNNYTFPSGWTEVADSGSQGGLAVAYKVATASEPSSYTITATNNNAHAGSIMVFANAAYDTIGAIATSSASVSAPSINVTQNSSVLLAIFLTNSLSLSVPSGMTPLVLNNDVTNPAYSVFSQSVSAGASGNRTSFVGDPSTQIASGVLMSIKPA